MTDAWQRRKEKDYPRMPKLMEFLFKNSRKIEIILIAFSLILSLIPILYILENIGSTWLGGGKGLLNDIPYIIEASWLGILGVSLRFIFPLLFSGILDAWYYRTRINFPEPQ